MTFRESITKEEVQQLPLIKFEDKIHIVNTFDKQKEALKVLNEQSVLGFDTETKPTFNKGEYNKTALIQLATEDEAFLFKINEIGFTAPLIELLSNKDIQKIGISIKDDLKDLMKMEPSFKPAGFDDLNDISKELGIKQIGMRSLSGIFLEHRVSKYSFGVERQFLMQGN
ncbi:MAG: 3'-5' exonuclease domain-containing protein 2 [Cyclobacteriaceae bacterium]